ncbi:MAG: cytochrome d ubiquinol oxidase subunit II [Acidobacteriaceae bacterium]|nr:cytochrome d ubiquinol oxidase subunit II [Acidobacteriaceae bacterium]
MTFAWFALLAILIVAYAVLDGFDLGVGAVQMLVAKTKEEREATLAAVGPFWGANEVCLVAAGVVLFAGFPILFAAAFAGYYLPLMMLLWLVVLRGISLEFRSHLDESMWRSAFDTVLAFSSVLIAIVLGAALGNVLRGVPLDAEGNFFEPLWTHFKTSGKTGVLDWYTIITGLTALATLSMHGASYLAARTEGGLRERCRRLANRLLPVVLLFTAVSLGATLAMLPQEIVRQKLSWGWVFPVAALASVVQFWRSSRREQDYKAFLYFASYIAIILAGAAYVSYPVMLRSTLDPAYSLTVQNSSADAYSLGVGMWWVPLAIALATGSFIYLYRSFRGSIAVYRPDFPVSVETVTTDEEASSD